MSILFANAAILAWQDEQFVSIQDGYLGVDGERISYIGTDRPSESYDEVRDMRGRLLMPGLINCHCHAAMVLLRGVGSDLPLDRWLFEKIFPIEDKLSTEDIKAGNELAMMEMLGSGVTSFSDMYMKPSVLIESNERIGMKVNLCRAVQEFDPAGTAETNTHIPESIALFEEYNGVQNDRVRIDFAIHAEYTINEAVAKGYAERVRPYINRGARMQLHLSETEKEHSECIQRHGMTPAAWFEKLGVFDLPTSAAHCVTVSDADMDILKRKGVSVIHNPTSNLKLGSGFAPIPEMLERGINVALGTDGAASNNNLNMFEEMHLASIAHKGYKHEPAIMQPADILRMATINGARLQGRDDTGALEVGKKADIVALDLRNKPHLYPAFDLMTTIVYTAQASDVCMTMVDGRILYEDGKYLTLDSKSVFENARNAVKRLYEGD